MISEKNKLQEYCQKNKLSVPIYNSWSSGEHHQLAWSAKISIIINGEQITMNTTIPTNTKTNAEKQAASIMLDYLQKNLEIITTSIAFNDNIDGNNDNIDGNNDTDTSEYKFTLEPQIIQEIYIIDLENKPIFNHKFEKNILYVGFLNSIHHSIKKYTKWHKCQSDNICREILDSKCNKLLYLIEGGTADLVDHFMSMMIYPVMNFIQTYEITPKIIIVSGDHAGWCTRACLEKILKWRKISNINIENSIL